MQMLALVLGGSISLLLALVALALAIAALRVAIGARDTAANHARRLERLSGRVGDLERRGTAPAERPAAGPAEPQVAPQVEASRDDLASLRRVKAQSRAEREPVQAAPTVNPVEQVAAEPRPGGQGFGGEGRAAAPAAPKRTASLEERLSTRVFVWIGGIALVLAGAYLVKYSYDHVQLSEAVRLSFGFVFGFVLLGAAEVARRSYTRIAQALAGASVAVLFAVLLAGVRLFELIPAPLGFVLMAGVTAGAVMLSLRHGPFVALLGLIGGFATPAMVSTGQGRTDVLFTYLLMLQIGLVVVNRRQGWSVLSLLTLLAALAWVGLYLVLSPDAVDRAWMGSYLLGTATVFVLAGAWRTADGGREGEGGSTTGSRGLRGETIPPVALGVSAMVASGLLLAMLTFVGHFLLLEMGMLGLLGLGGLVLARLDGRYTAVPVVTAGLSAITLLAWRMSGLFGGIVGGEEAFEYGRFAWVALGYGVLFAVGGYVALWGARRPAVFAAVSVGSAIVFLLIARFGFVVHRDAPSLSDWVVWLDWWVIAAALAGLAAVATAPLYWSRRVVPDGWATVNLMAVGAVVLAGLAVAMGLDHPWQATGWAALAVGVVVLRERFEIQSLPWAGTALSALAVATLVVPGPGGVAIGERVVFNVLLAMYGLPTVALALTAWRLDRGAGVSPAGGRDARPTLKVNPSPVLGQVHQAAAVGMGVLGVILLIRHGFQGPTLAGHGMTLVEGATYGVGLLVIGGGLLGVGGWLRERFTGLVLREAGAVVAGVGVVMAVMGPVVLLNPLWNEMGASPGAGAMRLLYAYGLPGLLLGGLLPVLRRQGAETFRTLASAAAVVLLLAFVLLNLLIRQTFHESLLLASGFEAGEQYAYSLAWVLFAILLAGLGIWRKSTALRYASLAVMLLAVAKVFLYDTGHLEDLYRVLSFLGLGVSLLVLGFVYQRFVFREQ
ncbi:MAG: DUF2339 domain-containing protein [Phycisphaeraceae bacterium]